MNRIGRYEVVAPLGKGGFGQVFRAWDPGVGRHVAIKIVTAETDADLLERFRHEAGTTANLIHKNIVTVYEFGDHEGMPFLAMELLEGQTLHQTISEIATGSVSLSLLDKVAILAQVAEGLHYAHARGVIHRDIKPQNIMRLPNGVVKILDFGIARALNSMNTRRTRDGDMIGTIMYMAPEQFRSGEADVQTDIFAFGDVAYELISGEHPFYAKDVGTMMFRITAQDPLPLNQRVLGIPEALERVVHHALAKDREIRYQTLEDVRFDLHPVLQELRAERARDLIAGARPLVDEGDTEGALRVIRQALELEPANTDARRLRDDIQRRIQQHAVRARVNVLLEQGDAYAAQRQYNDAMGAYESALRLDQADTTVRERLEGARANLEAKRKSTRLLAEARVQLDGGELTAASEYTSQALQADPLNTEAVSLAERIKIIAAERERQQRFQQEVAEVHRLRGACEFDSAMGTLDRLAGEFPEAAEIPALRTLVTSEQEEYIRKKRHEQFEEKLAVVRSLMADARLQEALTAIESVHRDHPDEPGCTAIAREILVRLDQERREHEVADALARAQAFEAAGSLDDALAAIKPVLATYADEAALIERNRDLVISIQARDRQLQIEQLARMGEGMLSESRAADALRFAEEALARFPGEESLQTLLARAQAAKAEADKRQFVQSVLAEVAALAQQQRWADALAQANSALRFHPDEQELIAAHMRVSGNLQREQERLAAHQNAIEEALAAGKWIPAILAAEAAREQYPQSPLFLDLAVRSWKEQRRHEGKLVTEHVRRCFASDDLDGAERHLECMRPVFGRDMTWQVLERELGKRKYVQAKLREAAEFALDHRYDQAEHILEDLRADTSTTNEQVSDLLDRVRIEHQRWSNDRAASA